MNDHAVFSLAIEYRSFYIVLYVHFNYLTILIFRSIDLILELLSVRLSVYTSNGLSTKSFSDFDLIWCVGTGYAHQCDFDPIQGQGQGQGL